MNSLHARRPPKLEQGNLWRNRKRVAGSTSTKNHITVKGGGGGSLRRPPNAGIEVPAGNNNGNGAGGGSSNGSSSKRFCNRWRIIVSVLILIILTYLFVQVRGIIFGSSIVKESNSGLRAKQNVDSNPIANLG